MDDIIIVRGAGDIATGIAHRLYKCGFRLLLTEIEKPTVVRRFASFANAVMTDEAEVEGVRAVKAECNEDIYNIWNNNHIPVLCDSELNILEQIKPLAIVDAILAKRNTGTRRDMAPITVGVGPGFRAGTDVDAVVETGRGHYLGKVIYKGTACDNTGIPGEIMGYSQERLLRAPVSGIIANIHEIGDLVKQGDVVAFVADEPVQSNIDGVIRGLIASNTQVQEGLKIGDIDPRGIREYCFSISDKARAVAGGVLEAILALKYERGLK
ncbi:MAG: selenium-dependent molybdenum cofactor biosynthesis protein YqeB [Clostridiaceae bacterium]|nr:selenium-dependent molybdenum cofactor biosynthesis protein YqeB [Clostridiaceae bacterium]